MVLRNGKQEFVRLAHRPAQTYRHPVVTHFFRFSVMLLITACLIAPAGAFFGDSEQRSETRELVVLLHGLGRGKTSMWLLASRLEDAGFAIKRVGYGSLDQTPDEILEEITAQINECCQKFPQSVHFVGHSLGGLMVRAYLQNNRVKKLGRVVLLGTPNKGTAAADHFHDSWLMKLLGPTANALGTNAESFPVSLAPPYYPVGIIAGRMDSKLNDPILPGDDDGLVSIEATKIDNMTDFIVIETGHSMMRYDREVADQTIAFIKYGEFETQ
jgi:hypothetical protein